MKYLINTPFGGKDFAKPFHAMTQDPDDVIVIEINSSGGDMYLCLEALAKVHECKQLGKKVVCYVTAQACSAGAHLMWAGDEIFVSPCSYLMFHQIWVSYDNMWDRIKGTFLDLKDKYWNKMKDDVELCNTILADYAPWDVIMQSHKKKDKNGDFKFSGPEFAKLFPDKVKVGAPPYKLEVWDEDFEDLPDIRAAMKDAIRDMEDEEEDDED